MTNNITIAPYAGAKNRSANAFIDIIPYNGIKVYAEPFGGTFGLGLKKAPHQIEIYSDINSKLALLLQTLKNQETAYMLLDMLCSAEYSKRFFDYAKEASNFFKVYNLCTFDNRYDDVFISCLVYSTLLMSFNGQMETFKGIRTGHEEDMFYKQIKKKLAVIERLKDVHVLNADGIELIKIFKEYREAFLYVDPPYTRHRNSSDKERGDIYEFEILDDELQQKFLNSLKDCKAKVLVCSYRNELYDNTLCSEYGFKRIDVAEVPKTMSIGQKGHKKSRAVEVAYVNYDIRECR